jgi:hypothetical protein
VVTHPGSAGAARSARRLNDTRRLNARRLNSPRPALVEVHPGGLPTRVNRQEVAVVREEWRVVDRWWTEDPVTRRYFDIVLESGENVVVYRDGDSGTWFTQRA